MKEFIDYETMAMLDLSQSERAELEARFDEITKGFSVLDTYNTDVVLPLASVLDVHTVLREDVSVKTFSRDELLTNTPEQHDGFFQVPAAI